MKSSLNTQRDKGIFALLVLALLFGILPLFIRMLGDTFSVYQQIYMRLALGSLFTFLFFTHSIRLRIIFSLTVSEHIFLFVRSFIYFFLGAGLYVQAILMTKISNVEFIAALPTAAIFGFLLLGEKVTVQKVSLVILSFLGVFIIAVKDTTALFSFGYGEIYAFLSAIFVGLGMIARKKQTPKLNDKESGMIMLLYGALLFFCFSLLNHEGLPCRDGILLL